MPYPYFKKKPTDHLQLIHQGGYKVYEIAQAQNEVAVIGYLRPCVGIAVTDGIKLIVFHKFSQNSMNSMESIIRKHLNVRDPSKLFAHIYTTRDDEDWERRDRTNSHGGNDQRKYITEIKNYLCSKLNFIRTHVPARFFNILDSKNRRLFIVEDYGINGRYDYAALCVAVRLDELFQKNALGFDEIKFTSIDPYTEDVFNFSGKIVGIEGYGINDLILYDKIPATYKLDRAKNPHGYVLQRDFCVKYQQSEEDELYKKQFGRTVEQSAVEDLFWALEGRISREELLKQQGSHFRIKNTTEEERSRLTYIRMRNYDSRNFFPLP